MTERSRQSGLKYESCPDCGAHTWVLSFLKWGLGVITATVVVVLLPLAVKINDVLGSLDTAIRVNTTQVDDMKKKVDRIDEALVKHLTTR